MSSPDGMSDSSQSDTNMSDNEGFTQVTRRNTKRRRTNHSDIESLSPTPYNAKKHSTKPTKPISRENTRNAYRAIYASKSLNFRDKYIAVISGQTKYSKLEISDIAVTKFIKEAIGNPISVKRTRQGEIAVECRNKKHLNILLSKTQIGPKTITVREPKNLSYSQGVIKKIGLDEDLQEIKQAITEYNPLYEITDIKRLQNRHRTDSEAVLLTFKGQHIPKFVSVGFLDYKVEKYIRHPIRCTKCQGYNHTESDCKSTVKCPRCSGEHSYAQCTKTDQEKKCPNCGNSHSAGYKGCPAHKNEVKVIKTQINDNVSYANAVKKVRSQSANATRPQVPPRTNKSKKPDTTTTPPPYRRRPVPSPRKSLHKPKPTNTQPQETPITIKTSENNTKITVDIIDFLNFFREASRVVALGTLNKEPSESVRDQLTACSNTLLGTNIQKGELQKRHTQQSKDMPEKLAKLNTIIASLLKPQDRATKPAKPATQPSLDYTNQQILTNTQA